MAKLYFSYAAMNAGKSTILLQAAYNYRERGMEVLLLTSALYKDDEEGHISSRIGIGADAVLYTADTDLYALIGDAMAGHKMSAIFVDEAQFLTKTQAWQLARVADHLNVPVLAYGLRTDFQGELFEGSAALLARPARASKQASRIRPLGWWRPKSSARSTASASPSATAQRRKVSLAEGLRMPEMRKPSRSKPY